MDGRSWHFRRPLLRFQLGIVQSAVIRVSISLVVSAVCLYLALRSVPFSEVLDKLADVQPFWVALAVGMQGIILAARALRWQKLLGDDASFADVFWCQAVGIFGNNTLPLRAGEVLRVVTLAHRASLPWPRVAGSVVLERFLDVAVILLLLSVLLTILPVPELIAMAGVGLGLSLAMTTVALIGLIVFGAQAAELLARLTRLLPARVRHVIGDAVTHLLGSLAIARNPSASAGILIWSLVPWVLSIVTFWFAARAVVPEGTIVEAAFAIAALAIASSLPSSPGFWGVFQLVGQLALAQPFPEHYSLSSALVVTLIAHLSSYLPTTALGAVAVVRLGLSFKSLNRAAPPQARPSPAMSRE